MPRRMSSGARLGVLVRQVAAIAAELADIMLDARRVFDAPIVAVAAEV